jgi:hypothetical protein
LAGAARIEQRLEDRMSIRDDERRGGAARTDRVSREVLAAKKLLASGQSQIDDVLAAVAARLAHELESAGEPGAVEERAPLAAEAVAAG